MPIPSPGDVSSTNVTPLWMKRLVLADDAVLELEGLFLRLTAEALPEAFLKLTCEP
jgi:hypothetical protein